MTTVSLAPAPIKADAAARGARRLELQQIDTYYRELNDDLTEQADEERAQILARLLTDTRTTVTAYSCTVTLLPVARIVGNGLPAKLAARTVYNLLGEAWDELAQLDARTRDTRGVYAGMRREARDAFDFDKSPPSEHRNEAVA